MSSWNHVAMLVWMPINSGGACTPISSAMMAPQSPPCATNFVYPRRFISTIHARAMWAGSQPVVVGLARKSVAGHRRNDHIERIGCISAVAGGIGQRLDDFQLFGDRARPSVRDDERQRIFMFRTDVNEVNVEPIDLGDELGQGVHFCFDLAPVVVCRPIARERLCGRELNSL